MAEAVLRPMSESDWKMVSEIYRQGIASGNATFETEVPPKEKWDKNHIKCCRIVAICDNTVAGWAALSPVSSRAVYSGVAEVSIYIADKYKGQKIGTMLLRKLISESEENGIWTLQAVLFPENYASFRLHRNSGFRVVGYRERIGKMKDVWRDTILMERRSRKT
jgi:phosphinothricin acetyltransferase